MDIKTLVSFRTRATHGYDERMTEKCSEIACTRKPIIEIVAWDGITLDTHLFLCRKHWLERSAEEVLKYQGIPSRTKIIKFVKDLRSYL